MNYLTTKKNILPFFLLFICHSISAQVGLKELMGSRKSKHEIFIGFKDKYKPIHRVTLQELGEDYIVGTQVNYLNTENPFSLHKAPKPAQEYAIEQIDYLRVKTKVFKNALIGGAIGFGVGLIVAKSQKPQDTFYFPKEVIYLASGLTFASAGSIVGALTSLRLKIPIHGKKANYKKHRKRLEKYLN